MNVGEFKEWLNQFDDETIVEIVYHTRGMGYYDQGGNATTVEFNPTSNEWGCTNGHYEYNQYGATTLTIGGYNE